MTWPMNYTTPKMKMLEKNNELYTNACLLLMIGKQQYRKMILAKWFTSNQAEDYITELIDKVITRFHWVVAIECEKMGINIRDENYQKKLDF